MRKISILAVFLGVCFVCTPLFALEGFKITAAIEKVCPAGYSQDRPFANRIYLTAENQLGEDVIITPMCRGKCINMGSKGSRMESFMSFGSASYLDLKGRYLGPAVGKGKGDLFEDGWNTCEPFYESGTLPQIRIPANHTVIFATASILNAGKLVNAGILEVYIGMVGLDGDVKGEFYRLQIPAPVLK